MRGRSESRTATAVSALKSSTGGPNNFKENTHTYRLVQIAECILDILKKLYTAVWRLSSVQSDSFGKINSDLDLLALLARVQILDAIIVLDAHQAFLAFLALVKFLRSTTGDCFTFATASNSRL